MSELEAETKPLLKSIMSDTPITLNSDNQKSLARWATMKTIVGEYAVESTSLTPQNDRFALREEGTVPNYFAVYIGRHNSESNSAWLRISQTMALSPDGPSPALNGMHRNTQSVAMICGPIFLYVLALRVTGIGVTELLQLTKLARIFPSHLETIEWPPTPVLSTRDMGLVAYALDDMKNLPNIRDGGEIK